MFSLTSSSSLAQAVRKTAGPKVRGRAQTTRVVAASKPTESEAARFPLKKLAIAGLVALQLAAAAPARADDAAPLRSADAKAALMAAARAKARGLERRLGFWFIAAPEFASKDIRSEANRGAVQVDDRGGVVRDDNYVGRLVPLHCVAAVPGEEVEGAPAVEVEAAAPEPEVVAEPTYKISMPMPGEEPAKKEGGKKFGFF